MDGSLRIGIHTSIVGNYLNALESGSEARAATRCKIFSLAEMWQGGTARIPEVDAQAFRARPGRGNADRPLVYPCKLPDQLHRNSGCCRPVDQAFHDEIVRAVVLGADFLVVHPGARARRTTGQAISTIVDR